MSKIICIGESLIDFTPQESGAKLKDVSAFTKNAGGAPCNVAIAVARLGGASAFLGMFSLDGFGDFLLNTLNDENVDITHITRTDKANTSLAFVALDKKGEREFSFYRSPGADMLYEAKSVNRDIFSKGDILHFCSVDLVECKTKYAHLTAIEYAAEKQSFVSFDPNLRFPLWENHDELKKTVCDFMQYADFLKLSLDELNFLFNDISEEDGVKLLFENYKKIKLIAVTNGKYGSALYTRVSSSKRKAINGEIVDTTAAGDTFAAAMLFSLQKSGFDYSNDNIKKIHEFASVASYLTCTKFGAVTSLPFINEINLMLEK